MVFIIVFCFVLFCFKAGGTIQIGFSAQNVLWSSILGDKNTFVPLRAAVSLSSR